MSLAKIGLPAFAGVLVVGAVVVTLWMIGSASGERAKFSSLEIAPKEADAFFAINTDPTSPQWLAVNDSLGALGAKDPIREAIDEALAEVNLDWEDDILPVAGDEAFFSVPSFDDVDGSSGFVAGFRIADENKAQEVFDDLRERAEDEGEELSEEQYEGVTIYFTESVGFDDLSDLCAENPDSDFCADGAGDPILTHTIGGEDSGAVALFGEVLAIGGSTDDVKSVIDVVQGRAPSAVENERLQEFRELQKDDFLMWGYADLATVWDIAEAGAATSMGTDGGRYEPLETPEPTVTAIPSETPAPETGFRVLSFDADYTIDDFGTLFLTETIAVDFGTAEKRGVVRDFDTLIPYDFVNDERIEILVGDITLDGVEVLYETFGAGGDRFILQVGEPGVTVTGPHTYVINYTIVGGVKQWSSGDPDFAYYEVILDATGVWGVALEQATVSFTTPTGTIGGTSCLVNVPEVIEDLYFAGEYDACSAEQSAENTVTFTSFGDVEAGSVFGFLVGVDGESGRQEQDVNLVPNEDFDFDFDGDQFDDDFDFEEEPLIPFDIDTEALFEQLRGTYDRVGFSISSTTDGFAFDVTVLHAEGFEPEDAFEPTAVFDSRFAEMVPAETMFFFAGFDLYGQNWLPARSYFEDVELDDGKTIDDLVDDFADETGFHLEDDFLSLLTGEYAVAGDVSDWDESLDFSVLALLDVSDEDRAQETLNDLGDYLEDQDLVRIDDDDPVQRWTALDQDELEDALGVTVHDGAVIAGYPDSAVEDAVEGFERSLASTDDWKRTVGVLPDDTTSIGFLSIARILEEARKLDEAEDAFEDATGGDVTFDDLEALRSVGFATTSRENGFGVHVVVFVEDQ